MMHLVITILLITSTIFCDVKVTLTNIAQGDPSTSRLNILVYQAPTDGLVQNAYVGLLASKILKSGDTMEFTVPDSFTVQGTDKLTAVKSWTKPQRLDYNHSAVVSNANGGISLTVDPNKVAYPPPKSSSNVRIYNAKDSKTQLGFGLFKQVLGKNQFVVGRDRIRAGGFTDISIKNVLYFVESNELTVGDIISLGTRAGKDWALDLSKCDSKHFAVTVTSDPMSGKGLFSADCVPASEDQIPRRSCQIFVNEDDAGNVECKTDGCTVLDLRTEFNNPTVSHKFRSNLKEGSKARLVQSGDQYPHHNRTKFLPGKIPDLLRNQKAGK